MTQRRRWILLPLAALAAILIVVVILFEWGWLKGPIASVASAALGRQIEFADLEIDMSTTPTVTLDDVRIANAEWGSRPHMLAIPRVELALRLWSLLRGKIELPFLRVQRPDLLLETNRQGEANWQFGPPDEPPGAPLIPIIEELGVANAAIRYREPGRAQDVVAALETVDGAISSSGVQLSADGTLNEEPLSLRLASAPVDRLEAETERFPFELDARIGSTRLAATGSTEQPLQAQGLSVEISAESQDLGTLLALAGRAPGDLGNLDLGFSLTRDDQLWTLQQLELRLGESDLTGTVALELEGEEPAITADLHSNQVQVAAIQDLIALVSEGPAEAPPGPTGEAAPADVQVQSGAPGTEPEAAVDTALAEAKAALAQDEQGGDRAGFGLRSDMLPKVDAEVSYTVERFSGPELALSDLDLYGRLEDGLPRIELTGGGQYRGTPVALDLHLGRTERAASADGAYPVRAQIEAANTQIQIEGEIGQPETLEGLDLRVQASSENISDVLALADISVPEIPPFLISGRVIQDDQVWRIADLYTQFSESELAGEVTLNLSERRPFVTADLQSNRLLVSDFLTAGEKPAVVEVDEAAAATNAENKSAEEAALISIEGVNFDALPELDADVTFTGEFVEIQEFRFDQLSFDLKLRDQVAVLDASGEGQFRGGPLSIEAHAGTEQSLDNPEARYPIELRVDSQETRVTVEGTAAKPAQVAGLDVDVALEGPNLNRLGEVLQLSLPTTPPFALQSNLVHDDNRWVLTGLNGTVGDTDIQGRATIVLGDERPTLEAELTSNRLDFDDLGLLVGAPADPDETASVEQERAAAEEAATAGVLPDAPFDVPELRAMDARVSYQAKQVRAQKLPLEGVVLDLTLEDGQLTFAPLRFDLADGELVSTIRLDGRSDVLTGDLELNVRSIRLNQLLGRFDIDIAEIEMEQEGVGTFGGHAQLAVRGNSIQELAASADGEIALIMRGGRINALIVEGLGLDVGEAVALLLSGEEKEQSEMVPIQCFVARFGARDGIMQAKALVLETSDSTITGKGEIDLGEETLALELLAHPKDASALSASTPIRIEGTFEDPKIDVTSEELQEKSLAALALGVVLPVVGAIIPFFEEGETEDANCAALIKAASAAMPPAASGQSD